MKIVNSPINGYSSTEGKITIPLKNIICGIGNQRELKRRYEEEKELKRRYEEEIRERIKIQRKS